MSLSTQHMQGVLNLIEVASNRGTWRAQELSQVGGLYDTITNELKTIIEAENAPVETEVMRDEVFK